MKENNLVELLKGVSKSDTEEWPEIPRLLSFTGTHGEEKASQ